MKLKLIQLWMGQIPDYFWYHYETTKNLKDVEFLIFTDSGLIVDSPNYKIVPITKSEIENKVSLMLNYEFKISNIKKINDLKSCLGELFEDHLTDCDFFGFYDIDTLFGDFQKWITPYMEDYDVISFADSIHHNRLCGPLTIIKNTYENLRLYRNRLPEFLNTLNNDDINAYEEHQLSQIFLETRKVKLIYDSTNCETDNGGKNTYDAYWSGGKVFVKDDEKLLYHFYRKNHTKFQRIGNTISASYDKKFVDDFLWVVHFSENYETLLPYLIDSIKKYSNRRCVLYSINYTPKFLFKTQYTSEQFIFRRIDMEPGPLDYRGRDQTIMCSKPVVLMDAIDAFPNKKFVHIDTDICLTTNADDITKYFSRLENYPLMNSHIHDVMYISNVIPEEEWTSPLHVLLDVMEIKNEPIFPRRKCNVIVFDENSKWFFNEQMEIYYKYKETKPGIFLFQDEDSANALLAKYQFKNALPLIDIEESHNLYMERIYNYSYNMTGTSPFVELPKNINDFLVFHGFKQTSDYDAIQQNYGNSTLDCEEFVITYSNNTLMFEKNSFMTTKQIDKVVDFVISDLNDNEIYRLTEQSFYDYWYFYLSDIFLEPKKYKIKILETITNKCIFSDILEIK